MNEHIPSTIHTPHHGTIVSVRGSVVDAVFCDNPDIAGGRRWTVDCGLMDNSKVVGRGH